MQNIVQGFAEQGPCRSRLRDGCPIIGPDLDRVCEKRQSMLDNGYPLVAVHSPWSTFVDLTAAGKQPLTEMEDGRKVSWRQGHSSRRLLQVTPYSANTGTPLGGAIAQCAIDLDPAKTIDDVGQFAFTTAVLQFFHADPLWPQLRRGLIRLRFPASVVILLRADGPLSKLKVAGQQGAVELLCDGQHVVVDGWHPRSLAGPPVLWRWHGHRSPWTVPVTELPTVPANELVRLMLRIGASGLLGPPRPRALSYAAGTSAVRMGAFAATTRLHALLETHHGLIRPAIRELVQQIGAEGCGRHDAIVAIVGRLMLQRWTDRMALDLLVPLVNESFQDGDWSSEIDAALAHARRRDAERRDHIREGALR